MTTSAFRSAMVTGATGFIGSHLARRLVEGGVATTLLVRPASDLAPLGAAATAATVVCADDAEDAVRRRVASAGVEVVFHLAATYVAHHRPEDVARLVTDNIALTAQVCEGAVQGGSRAILHSGTHAQHAGSPPGDATPTPNSLYAASKQAADDIIGYYAATGALDAATLKIYDTYGPGDRRGKFLATLVAAAREGQRLQVSAGEQRLHVVHVDDVVDGFIHAANLLLDGRIRGHHGFTLPSPRAVTLRALAEAWGAATSTEVPVDWGARPYREGEIMQPWEGTVLPGWSARVPLEEGLRRVYGGAIRGDRSA